MAQVGRISGPLLKENLLRNGSDLAFRNDFDTTQLLYLNVTDGKISVNNSSQSNYELQVLGTTHTVDLYADTANIGNINIINSTISAVFGNLNLNADQAIVLPALDNGTIFIDGNYISTYSSNANIDLTPHGTGSVRVGNGFYLDDSTTDTTDDLKVYGNLDVTGNFTVQGNINLGDANTDNITFSAEVTSNIDPNVLNVGSNVYNLGSPTKRWSDLHTELVNGAAVIADTVSVGTIDYDLRVGNIFYVDPNGTDSNVGDHILAPVAHIRRALELADASNGGPVTIYVAPGDYEEETPLVVPSNVSIVGLDIRNVNIFPTSYTLSEDVFHLNGETTIANITVKNFYYDDNKGYAFRYAPNAVISERSPYIQNVTVITQGTTITADDPRGFASGDAGRGAYVDGAELDPASVDASMLFHSCTFITPGADALVMTNGVRVEWLNSFTYFANRGLYAFNNSTGRVTEDGSTTKYGAEVRSIASANVYGNYGAVADGSDCLMYLIQHNFAYIGTGKDTENDNSLVIQENEVVEENSGQIHYVTTDHTGAFRVGDNFFIDFETGSTTIDLSALTADSLTGLVITTGDNRTFIVGDKVQTGNIRFSGNTVESLIDEFNVDTATGEINLNDNTNISGNVELDGNLTFDGTLNLLGDQVTDRLTFNVDFDQDINPNTTLSFNLGSASKKWKNIWLSEANVGDITIFDNVVTTNISNANLELRASGTGIIYTPNETRILNDLTVNGTSTFDDNLTINGNFTRGGGPQTGNLSINSSLHITQDLTVDQIVTLEEIKLDDNFITTTSSNADLELRAAGTGKIIIPNNTVQFSSNLSSNEIIAGADVNIAQQTEFNIADISSITITQNYITTNESNADLELRASGTGEILIPNNDLQIDNNLTVSSDADLQDTTITGTLTHTGDSTQTGNRTQTGNLTVDGQVTISNSPVEFEDINFTGNVIETTRSNSDLEFRASGTGQVVFGENVIVDNDLFASSIVAGNINIDQDLVLDEIEIPPSIIRINDNYISTKISNANLDLRANGTGNVLIPSNDVIMEQDLTVNGDTDIDDITVNGTVTHTGNKSQTGNVIINGNATISGLILDRALDFEDLKISGNVLETTLSNSDFELRAAGTGEVIFDENLYIAQDLTVGTLNVTAITIDTNVSFEEFELSSDIQFFDNVITTTNSNSNLELRAAGTGSVYLQNLEVTNDTIGTRASADSTLTDITFDVTDDVIITATGAIKVPTGTTLQRKDVLGDIRFDTTDGVFEGTSVDTVTFGGVYSSDRQTSVTADPTSNAVRMIIDGAVNPLDSTDLVGEVTGTGLTIHGLSTDNILFDANTISTTQTNADLELRANGAGELVIDDIIITSNEIQNNGNNLIFKETRYGHSKFGGTYGVVVPSGTTGERPANLGQPDPEIGDTRWNTTLGLLETWDGTQYISAAGISTAISEAEFNDLLLEYTLIFG